MTIDILTLFPAMFGACPAGFCGGPFDDSIIKRARDKKIVQINIHNLRKWTNDTRKTVDDKPYGGGAGMILKPEPIFKAIAALKLSVVSSQSSVEKQQKTENRKLKTVLLDAGGKLYNQRRAEEYSSLNHLILICGHYEGVDYRVHQYLADEVISIGSFVLTGGEIPAMIVVDSIVRLIPGVLNKKEATQFESFSNLEFGIWNLKIPKAKLLVEFPQYTRPEVFKNHKVPKILLSGNHKEIEKWRAEQSLSRTKKNRPDLLK